MVKKKIMAEIVATNVVASRPPNGDRLQRRPLVPISLVVFHLYNELRHTHKQEMELRTCVCTSSYFCHLFTDPCWGKTYFFLNKFYFILSYFISFDLILSYFILFYFILFYFVLFYFIFVLFLQLQCRHNILF